MTEIQGAIEAQEKLQARSVRELLEALLAGSQAPKSTRDGFDKIKMRIAELQAVREALEAATTVAELNMTVWPPAPRKLLNLHCFREIFSQRINL